MNKLKREDIKTLDLDRPTWGLVMYDARTGVCFGPVINGLEADEAMGFGDSPGDYFRTPEMEKGWWIPCYVLESSRLEAFLNHWGENLPSSSDQAEWLERWRRFEEYERANIPRLYAEFDGSW